jgi:SAM-dependent methyltransferase
MNKKAGFSYDGTVGNWWIKRAADGVHRRAYRNIADFIRNSFVREPRIIADYACGPGDLLALLALRFDKSKLVGLDGSAFMLDHARRRVAALPAWCAKRISLIHTPLPNLDILRGKADIAIFSFPNMVPFPDEDETSIYRSILSENDRQLARSLSLAACRRARAEEHFDPVANQCALEQARCISINLRHLLVRGGTCIRIEYATMQRQELSPEELSHVCFEEGSLDSRVDGKLPGQWFRLRASAYYRSRVLEDVYEQTGDERDRNGGYLITVLHAI